MKLLFFDFETTGIAVHEKVIEIAAAVYDTNKKEVLEVYNEILNPGRKLTDLIVNLTGITQSMVDKGISEKLGFEQMADFIKRHNPDYLCGHNIKSFDMKFLTNRNDIYDLGLNLSYPLIDTLPLSREIGKKGLLVGYNFTTPKGAPSFKLEYLMEYFQLGSQTHRAIDDVINNITVYNNLIKLEENDESLGF